MTIRPNNRLRYIRIATAWGHRPSPPLASPIAHFRSTSVTGQAEAESTDLRARYAPRRILLAFMQPAITRTNGQYFSWKGKSLHRKFPNK